MENEEWADELPMPPGTGEAGFTNEENDFMLNSLSDAPTLQEQLFSELATCDATPEVRRLAEEIIGSIDDTGYFRSTPADLAMSENAELADAEAALKLVQSFRSARRRLPRPCRMPEAAAGAHRRTDAALPGNSRPSP